MTRQPQSGFSLARSGRLTCLLLAAGLSGLLVLATRVSPDPRGLGTHEQLGLAPCRFPSLFHIPCPYCGGTTSFAHFVRGQWSKAVRVHPPAFVMALMSLTGIPWLIASAWTGLTIGIQSPGWLFVGLTGGLTFLALLTWSYRLWSVWA